MIYFITNQLELFDFKEIKTLITSKNIIQELGFDKIKYLGVDTETEGFDPYTKKLLSLQIGTEKNQIVYDWNTIGQDEIGFLREFFKSPDIRFIFHNAKFDLKFLYLQKIYPKNVLDTMLAEYVLHTGKNWEEYPKNLKHIAKHYLNVDLDKTVRGKIHYKGLDEEVIVYGADDVKYLELLYREQYKLLEENNLLRVFSLECQFVKGLAYTELCGLKLDIDKWKSKCESDIKKSQEIENQLNEFIISQPNKFHRYLNNQLDLFSSEITCKINWNSSTQVIELFKELGLNLLVKDKVTGKMKYSVEAPVLIPQKHLSPIIPIYLEYKGIQKTISTYGYNWLNHINPITKRLHTKFTQIIDTGRMSSGGKDKKTQEEYINFLNIPQDNEIRNCIIPEKDCLFIDTDYTGQETVILANYSKEPNMIKLINENGDMHSFVGKAIHPELAHLSDDEFKTQHKDKRQIAKAAGFAVQYGGNGYTIANNLSISQAEGDEVYNKYFKAFPELKKYFDKVQKETLDRGFILVDRIYGRRIYISFWKEYQEIKKQLDQEFWQQWKECGDSKPTWMRDLVRKSASYKSVINRMALNYPIQGTGALQIKKAVVDVFQEIENQNLYFEVKIVNIIYDQIILETHKSKIEEWSIILKNSMESAAALFCKNPLIKAEPEILDKWKK
jgi:DNA polymerase-1